LCYIKIKKLFNVKINWEKSLYFLESILSFYLYKIFIIFLFHFAFFLIINEMKIISSFYVRPINMTFLLYFFFFITFNLSYGIINCVGTILTSSLTASNIFEWPFKPSKYLIVDKIQSWCGVSFISLLSNSLLVHKVLEMAMVVSFFILFKTKILINIYINNNKANHYFSLKSIYSVTLAFETNQISNKPRKLQSVNHISWKFKKYVI